MLAPSYIYITVKTVNYLFRSSQVIVFGGGKLTPIAQRVKSSCKMKVTSTTMQPLICNQFLLMYFGMIFFFKIRFEVGLFLHIAAWNICNISNDSWTCHTFHCGACAQNGIRLNMSSQKLLQNLVTWLLFHVLLVDKCSKFIFPPTFGSKM